MSEPHFPASEWLTYKLVAGRQHSKEVSLEEREDSGKEIDRLVQDCRDRLTFKQRNLAECYIRGNAKLWLNLRSRTDFEEYEVIFQILPFWGPHGDPDASNYHRSLDGDIGRVNCGAPHYQGSIYTDSAMIISHSNRDEYGVAVRSGENMYSIQEVIPSLVWLKPAYTSNRGLRKFLYFGLSGEGFKYVYSLPDRELEFVSRCAVLSSEATDKLVETSPKILQYVADNGFNVVPDTSLEHELVTYVMSTHISFNNNGTCITIRTKDAINLPFEVTEVFFGPFNL